MLLLFYFFIYYNLSNRPFALVDQVTNFWQKRKQFAFEKFVSTR